MILLIRKWFEFLTVQDYHLTLNMASQIIDIGEPNFVEPSEETTNSLN